MGNSARNRPEARGSREPRPTAQEAMNEEGICETKHWCGRPDLNRHRPFGPTDFRTNYGFRRRPLEGVRGLDYPFTLALPL